MRLCVSHSSLKLHTKSLLPFDMALGQILRHHKGYSDVIPVEAFTQFNANSIWEQLFAQHNGIFIFAACIHVLGALYHSQKHGIMVIYFLYLHTT